MKKEQQEDEIIFPAGTIVVQYIHDHLSCLGVVVGAHMADRIHESCHEEFQARKEKEGHIILVLHHYPYNVRWSIFQKFNAFQFPTYIYGPATIMKRVVVAEVDLRNEIESLKNRMGKHDSSQGLNFAKLQSEMFCLSNGKEQALVLAVLVKHYMLGGSVHDVPEWLQNYVQTGRIHEKVLQELELAIPRV